MSAAIECYGMAERPDRTECEDSFGGIECVYFGPGISYWWLDTQFRPHTRYVEGAFNNPERRLSFNCIPVPRGISLTILDFGSYEICQVSGGAKATAQSAKTLGQL